MRKPVKVGVTVTVWDKLCKTKKKSPSCVLQQFKITRFAIAVCYSTFWGVHLSFFMFHMYCVCLQEFPLIQSRGASTPQHSPVMHVHKNLFQDCFFFCECSKSVVSGLLRLWWIGFPTIQPQSLPATWHLVSYCLVFLSCTTAISIRLKCQCTHLSIGQADPFCTSYTHCPRWSQKARGERVRINQHGL